MRDDVTPHADTPFDAIRETVTRLWREKIGPRKITVGDREVSDTVEAQTALILVNATRFAFKPGPRNYDRIWIRDGSSQALALSNSMHRANLSASPPTFIASAGIARS